MLLISRFARLYDLEDWAKLVVTGRGGKFIVGLIGNPQGWRWGGWLGGCVVGLLCYCMERCGADQACAERGDGMHGFYF